MRGLRGNPILWTVACVVGLFCGERQTVAEPQTQPQIPAMSANEFFQLPVQERRAVLTNALEQRLRLFENIAYKTKSRKYVLHEDLSTFPYGGEIPGPAEQRQFQVECVTRCRGESYWQESQMMLQESPRIKAGSRRNELRAVDASLGETFRAIEVINDEGRDAFGSISPVHRGDRMEGLLKFWGGGEAGWHDLYFIQETVQALENLGISDIEPGAPPRINSGMIGERETISFSYPFQFPRMKKYPGILTVHFDPARQFLPLAYRLECSQKQEQGRELRWFEAMRVEQAVQTQGIWFPQRFHLLKCNRLPTGAEAESVDEVRVESVSFGTVTKDDLAFTFPAGIEVEDNTTGVRYTADGKGGVQGEVQGIPYLNERYLRGKILPFLLLILLPGTGIALFLLVRYVDRRFARSEREQTASPGV
ncbi:hypothetical protein Pan153_36050 [Gimesia panareensis]|uniref:Uncharacterized protein n=2 Tax=Gimesia panareensis TaxID=2527978 RepID=A0A518FRH4_9PLAN|nr:hypothetical protein Pan153_36050 [Gimesia panareensis]